MFKAGAWLGDVQGLADSGVPFLFVCIYLFIIFAWLGVVQGLADSRVPFIFINVLFLFISYLFYYDFGLAWGHAGVSGQRGTIFI